MVLVMNGNAMGDGLVNLLLQRSIDRTGGSLQGDDERASERLAEHMASRALLPAGNMRARRIGVPVSVRPDSQADRRHRLPYERESEALFG